MPTENPFDAILIKLDRLQTTVNDLNSKVSVKETHTTAPDPNRLVDLPEAAILVKKPVGTVRYYIHHRNLPAKKIGKSYVIKYNDLMAWIETFDEDGQDTDLGATSKILEHRKRYAKHEPFLASGSNAARK